MADDKKIIFSMVGVSKAFQPNKNVLKRHLPVVLLWSEDWYYRSERFR